MYREMRRKRQLLTEEESLEILRNGTSGVLALSGDDGYPYAVPISYVYDGGKVYFHSAKSGHKIDAVKRCDKASFCVIDQDQVVPEEYTTYFKSVILFGRVHVMEDREMIRAAIEKIALKYYPEDDPKNREHAIEKEWSPLCMIEFTIEHMTGKKAIELV